MGNQIKISLPDGSQIESEKGNSVYDIIGTIGKGLQAAALAAEINGEKVDLAAPVNGDAQMNVITFTSEGGKDIFWHSASHLMAQAIKRLYPEAKFAIGPAIESGFYYDIDVAVNFTPEDLEKIEGEMQKIVDEALEIRREIISRQEALKLFGDMGETYKVEMIGEFSDDTVSMYRQGEFVDLCRGPHLRNTSQIKAFKLVAIAGAYWRGDEKNKMLQRIYGIAFPDKKELKKHLELIEEAKKRDHRRLGKELDLFSFSNDVGAGLPLWHPNGAILRFVIDKFETMEHLKRGYKLYGVPHIARSNLYETSGHLGFYTENMYSPIQIDGQDYYLKPMNCPSQIQIFNSSMKSYRDLPYRAFEMGTVYRYERSGVLHGLTRVRGFTQDDAHIFCREDQIEDEIRNVLEFTLEMLAVFGFQEKSIYLSTRPEKSVGTDANWEVATNALRSALEKNSIKYTLDPGEGVFYGPKIDIKIRDAIGREWQCSTIQVDFNLPERFDISYIGSDGQKHRPIMIHRALLGSLERFIGILIEHYSGKFPLWLAPIQVILASLSEEQAEYIETLKNRLLLEELRPEIDIRNESIGYKIREAIAKKVPFIAVVGKKEAEEGTVSVRRRGENKSENMQLDDFISLLKTEIREKK
ncbi:MAG: threonine--tRNA ligase [Spirochaetae bacterium HGW-Spirochaetae-1]|jgi:threonyl-tRNA synthetase|nr:MAG: threonine--tRNA ligase [Spirochaetae bacterium HGW-Spirochaetae-1]